LEALEVRVVGVVVLFCDLEAPVADVFFDGVDAHFEAHGHFKIML
jgi:hypothetical protein